MPYQYVREPLTAEETNRLVNACETYEEKLAIWTLLDTGLRVAELATLTRKQIDWQARPPRMVIFGKGGPYGKRTKRRVVPMSTRTRPLLEHHFALNDSIGLTARTIQRMVKRVANRGAIARTVTPHVLRHTFSVDSIRKGVSLPSLQRVLGHDHLTTTEIYLNMSPEDVLREYESKW
jgi:integrase/recombinase XerD